MLAWSSSSDFPGPGEARWSQVKPGGLSQCCWLPVLQTGGAKHAEPQSPIQPTLEGWKCGNFTTVIILRVTFLHRNENTKKVKSSLHMKVLCLHRCCKLYGNGRFNEGGKTETRCFSPKGGSMSPLHLSVVSSLDVTVIFHVMVETNNSWSGFNLGENLVEVTPNIFQLYNILELGGHEYLGWLSVWPWLSLLAPKVKVDLVKNFKKSYQVIYHMREHGQSSITHRLSVRCTGKQGECHPHIVCRSPTSSHSSGHTPKPPHLIPLQVLLTSYICDLILLVTTQRSCSQVKARRWILSFTFTLISLFAYSFHAS